VLTPDSNGGMLCRREATVIETGFHPHSAEGLAGLRRARERFLSEREVPAGVPPWLAAAWRRAVFHDVDVDRPEVPAARTPPRPRAALLDAAGPVLAHLAETLSGLGVGIVLADARGRVVDCWADPAVRRHLDAIQTRPGADLAESSTGVNALSHALATARPALIAGPQHLFGLYQETACAGAPIRDPLSGRTEAALALVSPIDAPVGLLEALAVTAGTGVERELRHRASAREQRLVAAYLTARAGGAAVAAFDGRTRLVSAGAAALLRSEDLDVLDARAADVVAGGPPAGLVLEETGVRADVVAVPGAADVGVVVRLTPHVPCARAGGSGPHLLRDAGLVGGSAEWHTLERAAARAVGSPGAFLVHGERGTGKTVAARAVLERGGARATVVTVWDHAEDRVVRAVRAVGDDAPLIVRHGDRLTPDLIHTVADVLRARRGPSAVTLATACEADEVLATWRTAAGVTAELAVPPLRDRGTDVAALVDHVATAVGVRLARDARDALRGYSWPGNVAELEHLLAALAALGGSAAVVAMSDLPGHVRRPGRQVGAMERAERETVIAALAASGGNKKRAAHRLGVSRATLYRKLRAHGLDR
jgi:sigma-54 dependent transcriptional regulator, acetoin dehydrogenase operon transcriptional activator AcoR